MTQNQLKNSNKVLLILGDSLSAAFGLLESEGWVSLLHKQWQQEQRGIKVINAAISGDTTDGGLARLPRLLAQHQPSHVLIELGGNDGLRGQSIKNMQQNLKQMIALAQQASAKVILQDMEIPTNYGGRYTRMFGETYDELSAEYEVPLIPFFLNDIALNKSLMQRDGIHPNKAAQPKIANFMHQQLTPLLMEE